MATHLRSNVQRLHRDLIELEREPMDGIQHHLFNGDMTHMCLILSPSSGPYRNLRLHLDVEISNSYPHDPPKISIQTSVTHPNVFGGYICCDILRHVTEENLYSGGYTPAYLLKYVFLQLLSFFSTYEVEQEHGEQASVLNSRFWEVYEDEERFRERMANVVMDYVCNNCGFNLSIPSVVAEGTKGPERIEGGEDGDADHGDATNGIDLLTDDCWMVILDRLSDQDMYALARASPHVMDVMKRYNLIIRRQLVCFFSRKTYTESVLGIGLEVDRLEPSGVVNTIRVLDLLSYEAFNEHGVRTGIFGEKFNVFLPVVLDDDHFLRAESTIREVLQDVHRVLAEPQKLVTGALCVVEVLPRLLNKMVLELAQDCQEKSSHQGVMKRDLEKALQGYCLLLHLFSKLSKRYPIIEIELRRRVGVFRESDAGRHKDAISYIGEFLTYLLVLNEDWQSYCVPYVEEVLARYVVWFLDGENSTNSKYPHLAYLEDDLYVSQQRLRETFDASLESLRLVMIQVSFLRLAQSEAEGLNSQYGYPSGKMSEVLFRQLQRIYAVKDWDVCMQILGFPPLGTDWQPQICKMLKSAVTRSESAGYHVVPYTLPQLFYLRMYAEPSCPLPSWYPRDEFTCDEFEYNIEKGLTHLAYQRPPVSFFPATKE